MGKYLSLEIKLLKIIQIISFSDFRDHTSPLFKNLSILPIDDLNNEVKWNFSRKHFLQHLTIFSSQIITSIVIIQGPHQKSTKNRPTQIIKNFLLNLKGVKFGTTFLHLSKTQNHLRYIRKILKCYLDLLD